MGGVGATAVDLELVEHGIGPVVGLVVACVCLAMWGKRNRGGKPSLIPNGPLITELDNLESLQWQTQVQEKHGDVCRVISDPIGNIILVSSSDIASDILKQVRVDKNEEDRACPASRIKAITAAAAATWGDGTSLSLEGKQFVKFRDAFGGSLSYAALTDPSRQFFSVLLQKADELVECLSCASASEEPVILEQLFFTFAHSLEEYAFFGNESDIPFQENRQRTDAFSKMFKDQMGKQFVINSIPGWLQQNVRSLFLDSYDRMAKETKDAHATRVSPLIDRIRKASASDRDTALNKCIVARLLENQVADDQIYANTVLGHTATQTAQLLSTAVVELSGCSDLLSQIVEEIAAVHSGPWCQLRLEDFRGLQGGLLEAAYQEALRISPQPLLTPLETTTDIYLRDGRLIQNGAIVFFLSLAMSRHPSEVGLDAGSFAPNRWRGLKKEHDTYNLLFGGGLHPCSGRELARLITTVLLAATCRDFTFTPLQGQEITSSSRSAVLNVAGDKGQVLVRRRAPLR